MLMLPDESKSFHVVCDASNFAIGCALMHENSRQMKPAEINYPVHDKELLVRRYPLIKVQSILAPREDVIGLHRSRIIA